MSNAAALELARTNADAANAMLSKHVEERELKEQVAAIFCMMDTDSDGYLSVEEAHRVGKLLGIALPERHSVHVRGVSLHQFMGWVLGLSRVRGNVEVSDFESTVLQFHIFLKNRKGLLERTAIQQWMVRNKLDATEAELDELMEMMNASSDPGGVNYDDLLSFYTAQSLRR